MLEVFDVSFNNLCGPIPRGTQFITFSATTFQMNKNLYGWPLAQCNEKEIPMGGDNGSSSGNIKVGWLRDVDEKMLLTVLTSNCPKEVQ